jgi:hypothetical protein
VSVCVCVREREMERGAGVGGCWIAQARGQQGAHTWSSRFHAPATMTLSMEPRGKWLITDRIALGSFMPRLTSRIKFLDFISSSFATAPATMPRALLSL